MSAAEGGSGSAFSGLLGTLAAADSAGGGADAGAGSSATASTGIDQEKQREQLRPPPQPSLPVRMPRRSSHRLDVPSSACSWASSSASSSCSSRASASLSGLLVSPGATGNSATAAGTSANAAASDHAATPAAAAVAGASAVAATVVAVLATAPGPAPMPPEVIEDCKGKVDDAGPQGSAANIAPAGHEETEEVSFGGRARVGDRAERTATKKVRDLSDFGGYCCFRDGRPPRRSNGSGTSTSAATSTAGATSSPCMAIREDRPETAFLRDVAVLELRSLLRRHAVEPSDALVRDLLQWQAAAVQRAQSPTGHGKATS
mmetsp:Transcript_98144/g.246084  ORF Transcript_98144/g.246084 Transcript_98144/m.246084 type:complete len:318 (-) Transcript_98144:126-1079(-)